MFSCRFHLFCLVGILYICFCVGNSNVKKCVETERQALLRFKVSLIDGKDIISSWKGEDCCKWEGITCDNSTGHVTELDLSHRPRSTRLRGKIDSSLCELQHLTSLILSNNNLEGKIPECIGSLSQLITLDLEENGLVGAIPHALGNLFNLKTLNLGENDILVANDLEWVTHLSNLRDLDLSYSNLSQATSWLSSINKLPSLLNLELDFCGLFQFNLKSIPKMNSSTPLKTLSLSGNYINSTTLPWVLNVSKVLTYLDLSHNYLQHISPKDFANMISLGYLDLSSNFFQHDIPEDLANMSSLGYLDLSNNELEGSIPKSFRSWCQLDTLILSSNKLSGQLSDYVQHLCSDGLRWLDLSHNMLNGTFPYNIGQLPNLYHFSIHSNKLNGVLDEVHLSNLPNLIALEVSQTSLSFNLSSNWVPPFDLSHLSASSCNFGPSFPSWLKHLRSLEVLQISNCGITGSIPTWFWDLSPGLLYLNVSHNKLSGALPNSIPRMKEEFLEAEWDLSSNNFSGPLPQFPRSLGILNVTNNMFSGSISSFCGTPLSSLTSLDLSNNFLEGRLPNCWGKFQILKVLNLAANNFSGRIPKSFGTLQQIETIHLNNNHFSGEIPPLTRCWKLKLIDFGDNDLKGTLPAWVGQNLHHLIVLILRGNKFQGSIPASLCDLSHLQVLDLSKNNITGKIPVCLDHIIALSNINYHRETISYSAGGYIISFEGYDIGFSIDKAILAWKGANREYGKILGLLTAIDLSCNQLIGEIPHSIVTLAALVSLNLSGNNLTGFIPNNIGNMKMLESLDLSRNYLDGRIPSSFSNLTYLSYMNLSFNNLSGMIPVSTQLQTFDAYTYIGNPDLCGPPLSKKCPEDENSSNPQLTDSSQRNGTKGDEDELISFGFYISLVLGFIIGFWGVCGTLILKTSCRRAYFQFFNNMNDWIYVHLVIFPTRLKRILQAKD